MGVQAGTKEADELLKKAFKKSKNPKVRAQEVFNAWIRKRDEGLGCIACGSHVDIQAGHFYSAGHHNHLRFNEHNTNGECLRCNYYLHGNLIKYRIGLEKKIGAEALRQLDFLASFRVAVKNDKFLYLEIIKKYK